MAPVLLSVLGIALLLTFYLVLVYFIKQRNYKMLNSDIESKLQNAGYYEDPPSPAPKPEPTPTIDATSTEESNIDDIERYLEKKRKQKNQ